MRLKCELRPNPEPLPPPEAPRPTLKSTALGRMDDLHHFLRQCDEVKYISSYEKLLSTATPEAMHEYTRQVKQRCAWLASEEQREYKRAKLLNVMGGPIVPLHSADVDAFCSKVLEQDESLEQLEVHFQTPALQRPPAGAQPCTSCGGGGACGTAAGLRGRCTCSARAARPDTGAPASAQPAATHVEFLLPEDGLRETPTALAAGNSSFGRQATLTAKKG